MLSKDGGVFQRWVAFDEILYSGRVSHGAVDPADLRMSLQDSQEQRSLGI